MQVADLTRGLKACEPGSRQFSGYARALAEAAFSADRTKAQEATEKVCSEIIEPWADQFEPSLCESYACFMAEVLFAPGSPVAEDLRELGFSGPGPLLDRHRDVCAVPPSGELECARVKKVAVLSRVTLGADVAVTRRILQFAAVSFPSAEIEFIAPKKNADLIVRGHRVGHRPVAYGRNALLAERLVAWYAVLGCVRDSIAGFGSHEWLVIDPDSRLTQLGLLPVADDRFYRFFASRSDGVDRSAPLGDLAEDWCRATWGAAAGAAEALPMPRSALGGLERIDGSGRPVAAVSFGVGGRESKRLGGRFEDRLLDLLRRRNFVIALDYGLGASEERVVDERIQAFSGSVGRLGLPGSGAASSADLMTWKGSLSGFGDWTAAASLYIGYDSAAAHIAAAHGTPVIEVFAGAPNERFRRRWTPAGASPVQVIPVEGVVDEPRVLAQIDRLITGLGLPDGGGGWSMGLLPK